MVLKKFGNEGLLIDGRSSIYRYFIFWTASSQKNCCSPKQWTGAIIQRIGRYDRTHDTASVFDAFSRVTYDSVNMKIADIREVNNFTSQTMTREKIIKDFNKKKEWVIIENKCTVQPLTDEFQPPCIPDDAVLLGSYNFSGPSLKTYLILTPGGEQKRMSVTDNSCLPVTETILTAGPDFYLSMDIYENVTSGISDPIVFNIPTFCPSGNEQIKIQPRNKGEEETLFFETYGKT